MQVKYYIWLLSLNGVEDASALLEYPKLRSTKQINITDQDKKYLQALVSTINICTESEVCPPKINAGICKKCSYYELCYCAKNS